MVLHYQLANKVLLIGILGDFVSKTDYNFFLKTSYSPTPRVMFTVLLNRYTVGRKNHVEHLTFMWKGFA